MHKYTLFAALAAAALYVNVAAADQMDSNTPAAQQEQQKSGAIGQDESAIQMRESSDAPAVVPGSASPGKSMESDVEVEGTHGGARDATGGYDAAGPIQKDEDAEASAAMARESALDYESPLHQRNLQEAMDPKNARFKSRSTGNDEAATEDVETDDLGN